jgi:hypothetical protein
MVVKKIDGIGPEQNELAVGEIENPHHAGNYAETQYDKHHHRRESKDVEDKLDIDFHHTLRFCVSSADPFARQEAYQKSMLPR